MEYVDFKGTNRVLEKKNEKIKKPEERKERNRKKKSPQYPARKKIGKVSVDHPL